MSYQINSPLINFPIGYKFQLNSSNNEIFITTSVSFQSLYRSIGATWTSSFDILCINDVFQGELYVLKFIFSGYFITSSVFLSKLCMFHQQCATAKYIHRFHCGCFMFDACMLSAKHKMHSLRQIPLIIHKANIVKPMINSMSVGKK